MIIPCVIPMDLCTSLWESMLSLWAVRISMGVLAMHGNAYSVCAQWSESTGLCNGSGTSTQHAVVRLMWTLVRQHEVGLVE